ncbi:hypothetical protein [Enterobacter bugandensis]|uniref:hypothetical protein n=1 Tax=Enterobacter bugandensis TaxID=881260 RepID=UPI00236098FA|nr:hypothetical protein [Enterobacter bugandensis]
MDNREIEHPALMQQADAGSKDGIKTAEGQPASVRGVDPGVVNFRATIRTSVDGEHFPLTAKVKYPQDRVEYLKTADFWSGTAAWCHQMG